MKMDFQELMNAPYVKISLKKKEKLWDLVDTCLANLNCGGKPGDIEEDPEWKITTITEDRREYPVCCSILRYREDGMADLVLGSRFYVLLALEKYEGAAELLRSDPHVADPQNAAMRIYAKYRPDADCWDLMEMIPPFRQSLDGYGDTYMRMPDFLLLQPGMPEELQDSLWEKYLAREKMDFPKEPFEHQARSPYFFIEEWPLHGFFKWTAENPEHAPYRVREDLEKFWQALSTLKNLKIRSPKLAQRLLTEETVIHILLKMIFIHRWILSEKKARAEMKCVEEWVTENCRRFVQWMQDVEVSFTDANKLARLLEKRYQGNEEFFRSYTKIYLAVKMMQGNPGIMTVENKAEWEFLDQMIIWKRSGYRYGNISKKAAFQRYVRLEEQEIRDQELTEYLKNLGRIVYRKEGSDQSRYYFPRWKELLVFSAGEELLAQCFKSNLFPVEETGAILEEFREFGREGMIPMLILRKFEETDTNAEKSATRLVREGE